MTVIERPIFDIIPNDRIIWLNLIWPSLETKLAATSQNNIETLKKDEGRPMNMYLAKHKVKELDRRQDQSEH